MKIVKLTAENVKRLRAKVCPACAQSKPFSEFYADASKKLGIGTYCKGCSIARAATAYQRRKTSAKVTPQQKKCGTCRRTKPSAEYWRSPGAADGLMPECKSCRRDRVRAARYGLSRSDYERLLAAQSNACACCGAEVALVVDHRHGDGLVRGLLCSQCNTAIGLMAEDPERLLAAAAYLLQTSEVTV